MRVHAKGSIAGDTFTAARVELQNSNTALPVNVNGTIDTVTGTAGAFQFNIGSRRIKGDAQTAFFGDGDRPDSFASLKEGSRVEVKGEQRDDFIYAVADPHQRAAGADDANRRWPGFLGVHSRDAERDVGRQAGARADGRHDDGQDVIVHRGETPGRRADARRAEGRPDGARRRRPAIRWLARRAEDRINDDATGGEFEIEGSWAD